MKTSRLLACALALLIALPSLADSDTERKRRRRGSSGPKAGLSISLNSPVGSSLNFRAWDLLFLYYDLNLRGAVSTWGVNGEYSPNGTSSLFLSVQGSRITDGSRPLPEGLLPVGEDYEFNGLNLSLHYRYFSNPNRKGNTGVFYSPYLTYRSLSSGDTEFSIPVNNDIVQTTIRQNAFGFGFLVGYVYEFEDMPLFVDLHVGLGNYITNSFSTGADNESAEGYLDRTHDFGAWDARFGLNLGYRFPL